MKKTFAVLSLCSCLLPGLALADELDGFADKVIKDGSMKCTDEASAVMMSSMRNMLPELFLGRLREKRQLGKAWGPGNDNYRQARDLLEKALLDDEAKQGPITDFSARGMLRAAAASWTPEQRTEYLAFFQQPGGRLFWGKIADNIMCPAIINVVRQPLNSSASEAQLGRLKVLELGLSDAWASMEKDAATLPSEQSDKLKKLMPELTDSLKKAFGSAMDAYPKRVLKAFEPKVPELLKIAEAYKP